VLFPAGPKWPNAFHDGAVIFPAGSEGLWE